MKRSNYKSCNVPGIPRAPIVKFYHPCDIEFERVKQKYSSDRRLTDLNKKQILHLRHPHIALFQHLLSDGYYAVVEEIFSLKQMEQTEVSSCLRDKAIIFADEKLLNQIAQTLKLCKDYERADQKILSANSRFMLGQNFMLSKDYWLAHHFYNTALVTAKEVNSPESCQFQAKVHCLLAYLGLKNLDRLKKVTTETIDHLEEARQLSRGTEFWFHSKLMEISLKKPIAIYGMRDDRLAVNILSQSMYNVITMIYFNILMDMVTKTMSDGPIEKLEDFLICYKLSYETLVLAQEIRNSTAISSALVLHGMLLREHGNYKRALTYFYKLRREGEIMLDFEAQAIACANIAFCFHGMGKPVEALSWLDKQKEICLRKRLLELEADCVERTGHILLQEGHTLEADESFYEAYNDLIETHAYPLQPDSDSPASSRTVSMSIETVFPSTSSFGGRPSSISKVSSLKRTNLFGSATSSKRDSDNSKRSKHVSQHVRLQEPSKAFPSTPFRMRVRRSESDIEKSWAFAGIAAGQQLWGRMAGHCRQSRNSENLLALIDFKESRKPMMTVPSPDNTPPNIYDVYSKYNKKNIPKIASCDLECMQQEFGSIMKITPKMDFTDSQTSNDPSSKRKPTNVGKPNVGIARLEPEDRRSTGSDKGQIIYDEAKTDAIIKKYRSSSFPGHSCESDTTRKTVCQNRNRYGDIDYDSCSSGSGSPTASLPELHIANVYESDSRLGSYRRSHIRSKVTLMISASKLFLGRALFPAKQHGGLSRSQRSLSISTPNRYSIVTDYNPDGTPRTSYKTSMPIQENHNHGQDHDYHATDSTAFVKEFHNRMSMAAKPSIVQYEMTHPRETLQEADFT